MFYLTRRPGMTRLLIIALVSALAATGCGKGSKKNVKIPNVKGPYVSFIGGILTMSVVLEQVQIDYGLRLPVPKMTGSFLEVGPDFQSNGYLITIGLDPQDVKRLAKDSINLLDPTALPGGRPIPGVAKGELPALAIEIPKWHHLVIYAGNEVFGIFVPVKLPWQDYMGTFRFYDPENVPIGNISIVGGDDKNEHAGFLLLLNLKGKVGQLIGLVPKPQPQPPVQ